MLTYLSMLGYQITVCLKLFLSRILQKLFVLINNNAAVVII